MIWLGLAWAEMPPPSYRDSLMESARAEVRSRAQALGVAAAAEFVERWERTVGPDARVEYELGLAWRLAGDDAKARGWLDRAVERDPGLVAARYDRGELRLNEGDLVGAREDFAVCAAKEPRAWPGPFRLADVAARQGDAVEFEAQLVVALRHGFPLATVTGDPHWRAYWRDPALGPVLRKLGAVYADPQLLEAFE